MEKVCEDNISVLCGPSESPYGTVTKRLVACMRKIQQHGRALEPVVASFTAVYHHYDFDPQMPGNGYRTLVKVGPSSAAGSASIRVLFIRLCCCWLFHGVTCHFWWKSVI